MTSIDRYIANRCAKDGEFATAFALESEKLDIAVELVKLRRELGLSQKQLAEISGKPQSTIARIESGTLNPSVGLLTEIAGSVGKRLEVRFSNDSDHDRTVRASRRKRAFERIGELLDGSTMGALRQARI